MEQLKLTKDIYLAPAIESTRPAENHETPETKGSVDQPDPTTAETKADKTNNQ